MSEEACCTCAALLSSIPPTYDEKTEKPTIHERRLECCNRAICARCTTDNPRFTTYCPFCQISIAPSALPQGLREPPPYSESSESSIRSQITWSADERPPPYSNGEQRQAPPEKPAETAPDVLHFVDPDHDTVQSLSLRYGIPAEALRRTNGLFADHLMAARRTVLIPREHYKGGVSLSPRPIEGEEEELRKSKIRKWMVACKVSDIAPGLRYDVALLYLQQTDYDLDAAIENYREDERWEKEHPMESAKRKSNAKSHHRKRILGLFNGLTGQMS